MSEPYYILSNYRDCRDYRHTGYEPTHYLTLEKAKWEAEEGLCDSHDQEEDVFIFEVVDGNKRLVKHITKRVIIREVPV